MYRYPQTYVNTDTSANKLLYHQDLKMCLQSYSGRLHIMYHSCTCTDVDIAPCMPPKTPPPISRTWCKFYGDSLSRGYCCCCSGYLTRPYSSAGGSI